MSGSGNGSSRHASYDGPILECKNLSISYFTRAGEIPAVVDFNLTLNQGDSVGLVGESGCGKSTVAMAIMQYLGNNGGIVGGQVIYKGRDLATFGEEEIGVSHVPILAHPLVALLARIMVFHERHHGSAGKALTLVVADHAGVAEPAHVPGGAAVGHVG